MLYPPSASEDLKFAIRRFESGLFEQAGAQLLAILQKNPKDQDALYFLRLVQRRLAGNSLQLAPGALPPAALIWQLDPAGAWERDWLHEVLAGCFTTEAVDKTWSKMAPVMIVVDNRIVPEKAFYYREAFEAGYRIILVHLSDEAFIDDTGIYKYCDGVVRNYYSEILAGDARVHFIPLGCKAGFGGPGGAQKSAPQKSAGARKYLWSFAGDAKKSTRAEMLKAMKGVADGYTHLTEGFGSADALATPAYRALLDESVFVPSPCGWSNLESFRTYEALEAGCIPIVETRPGFDYYTALLGANPIPAFASWDKAAAFMKKLSMEETEALRVRCAAWWQERKPVIARDTRAFISGAFRGPF